MKEQEKNRVQSAMNRSLSGLKENPFLTQRILSAAKEGQPVMKRKVSIAFVLTAVVALVTVTALAFGLVFSPQYEAKRLALEALHDQYGITDEMMTVFRQYDSVIGPHGERVFLYEAAEEAFAEQIGVYSVTVQDGKANAVWNHDGKELAGGLESDAWGAEQLALLCSRFEEKDTAQPGSTEDVTPVPTDVVESDVDPAAVAEAEARAQARQAEWEESRAQVEAAAQITLEEAKKLAIAAVGSEYDLTDAQREKFVLYEDSDGIRYSFIENQPVVDLYLRLTQAEDRSHTKKDGIYVVTVNMETGVIEDVTYDSGLAANE